MLADPKALQYVLQTSGYRFPKNSVSLGEIHMIFGHGILWVHGKSRSPRPWMSLTDLHVGEQHQRQRKIMNPAFSVPQLKSFLPVFLGYAEKVQIIVLDAFTTSQIRCFQPNQLNHNFLDG